MLRHLAIIMDGNGRWAEKRMLPRSAGHKAGADKAIEIAKAAEARGIEYLTLFCFSTENWKRPRGEVDYLMGLFSSLSQGRLAELRESDIRILHLGSRENLPEAVLSSLDKAVSESAANTGMTLQLAINYGGLDEISRAVKRTISAGEDICERSIMAHLDNPEVPPPDFIVRSGGEKRLSGFLLYLSSYAEIGFYDRLWPDWDAQMLDRIIKDFQSRDRRFGGL